MPILFGQHKCTSSFEDYLKKKRLKATLCNSRKWPGFTKREQNGGVEKEETIRPRAGGRFCSKPQNPT